MPHPRTHHALLLALSAYAGLVPCVHAQSGTKVQAQWQHEIDERAVLLDPKECLVGRQVADVELTYLDGTKGRLSENLGPRGLVVFVRGAECPVSKRYGSETARIEDEFRSRGFGFLFVDMEDPSAPEATREEIETFGFEDRYALDPEQRLGAELGATRTSEAFLLDHARTLVYRGAIDDQYGRGVTLAAPRTSFLRAALEALLAGEAVQVEATLAPGCVLAARAPAEEAAPERGKPTYHREVSRILQRNCIECHRKGGGGPFALDQLEAVRRKSATIRTVLDEGSMPPWFASPDCGPFLKERRLSAEERGTVLAWLAAGAPEGDVADAPEALHFHDGWQIGEPDVIVSMPVSFQVPAEGIVDIQRFESVVPTTEDMWVSRIQILPEAVQAVHHIGVSMLLAGQREDRFYGYQPGGNPLVYEDGVALFVPEGARFAFEVHYTPNGVAATDRTRMGFVLAKQPPEFMAVSRSQGKDLFIPAGASHVSFTDSFVLPYPVLLRSLTPHMHVRGKGFRFEAFLPDGTRQLLLQLDSWDSDWQRSYEFRDWRPLPKGTKLDITAWYDNSAANPDNPDPTVDVRNGPQTTTDEMMFYAIEWVMPNRKH